MGSWEVRQGDALEVLRDIPDNSVDSVVTDPPYELGFMGRSWDRSGIAYRVEVWAEVLRVLKAGGHLLAFGGTRTYHRMACAIEDAGFEIRDCIMWLYGTGFPKSVDVSLAIDKALGAVRRTIRVPLQEVGNPKSIRGGHGVPGGDRPWMQRARERGYHETASREPVTDEAARWQGWGTALKPAVEPIVLARKPLAERNLALNVMAWGTGALNIDGCRIGLDGGAGVYDTLAGAEPKGRWPANVILDEVAAAMLDEQSGIRQGGARPARRGPGTKGYRGWPNGTNDGVRIEYESGGASRFFYVPKASVAERTHGGRVDNAHPTVKPLALMRYLVRLVTPPGGVVLDPFAGSGTTILAAVLEGFSAVGIEREAEYSEIIRQRMEAGVEAEVEDKIEQVALPFS